MEDEPERPLGMSRKHCVPNWDLYRQQLLPHIMEVETDRRAVYALKAIGPVEILVGLRVLRLPLSLIYDVVFDVGRLAKR